MIFDKITSLFRKKKADVPVVNRLNARDLAELCNRASAGDTEARAIGIEEGDELAPLGNAINRLLDTFEAYVRESSAAMQECSQGRFHRPILLRGMPGIMLVASRVINRAALKMKEANAEIARLEIERQDVMENVNVSIGAACEELSATAKEIMSQASSCANFASTAVKESDQATRSAQELTEVGETIKGVVKLIKELAEETNLLAINATIEASHAGVHGRGFAVVANGVKQLSQDTKDATAKIGARVAAIDHGVTEVTTAITTIASSVSTLNANAATITTSVNEQLQATEEISRRVAEMVSAMGGHVRTEVRNGSNGGARADGREADALLSYNRVNRLGQGTLLSAAGVGGR